MSTVRFGVQKGDGREMGGRGGREEERGGREGGRERASERGSEGAREGERERAREGEGADGRTDVSATGAAWRNWRN